MIERLEQLTIGQFVDMICGDGSVLCSRHEVVSADKLHSVTRNIALEYEAITDSASVKSYLMQSEELVKAEITRVVLTICEQLAKVEYYDHIREVLSEMGINAKKMTDDRLIAEVSSRNARAKKTIDDITKEKGTGNPATSDVRRLFDEQTAALMAHFKFQIDTTTMKATIYAHLVARNKREIKAQIAAMKKTRN